MNRADRRRSGTRAKPKVYTLTEDQIKKIKDEAVDEAFVLLMCVPTLVLSDKFCFDSVQLDNFNHYALSWMESVQNGDVTLTEVMRLCEEEAGVQLVLRDKK